MNYSINGIGPTGYTFEKRIRKKKELGWIPAPFLVLK